MQIFIRHGTLWSLAILFFHKFGQTLSEIIRIYNLMLLVVHGRRITEMKRNNLLWTAARSEATSKVTDRASAEDGGVHSDGNLNGMNDAEGSTQRMVFLFGVFYYGLRSRLVFTGTDYWCFDVEFFLLYKCIGHRRTISAPAVPKVAARALISMGGGSSRKEKCENQTGIWSKYFYFDLFCCTFVHIVDEQAYEHRIDPSLVYSYFAESIPKMLNLSLTKAVLDFSKGTKGAWRMLPSRYRTWYIQYHQGIQYQYHLVPGTRQQQYLVVPVTR